MEEDVDFYKKVKKALTTKEGKDGGFISDGSAGSISRNHQQIYDLSPFPPLPRPKKYLSDSGSIVADKFDSQSSNKTCETGRMTLTMSYDSSEKNEEGASSPYGKILVRPRSIDYCE
mmetsp:Transcript_9120/g.17183  ORF Transcript_9120/g.17183 Transcript_9120/m.17183 type:complete len:117 (+) Transcript_9120:86-436(+)